MCSKFSRRCIYEKHVKTPLTRKHLAEVEAELARTKALLRQVSSERTTQDADSGIPRGDDPESSKDSQAPTNDVHQKDFNRPFSPSGVPLVESPRARERQVSSTHDSTIAIDRPNDSPSSGQYLARSNGEDLLPRFNMQSTRLSGLADIQGSPNRPIHPSLSRRSSYRRSQGGLHHEVQAQSVPAPGLTLETPPSSGSFEWDERTGKASGDRFVNGMASLTSRSNEGGYLGTSPILVKGKYCNPLTIRQELHQVLRYFV